MTSLLAAALVTLVAFGPGACVVAPQDDGETVPAASDPGAAAPAPAPRADTDPGDTGPGDTDEDRAMTDPSVLLVAAARGPIPIDGPRTRIPLDAVRGAEDVASALAAGRPAEGRAALLVHDLRAEGTPGVLFDLYLVGTSEGQPETRDGRFVGSINFYGADPERAGFQRFELAAAFAELQRRGELSGEGLPSLLVVPEGRVASGSSPSVGRLELILDR